MHKRGILVIALKLCLTFYGEEEGRSHDWGSLWARKAAIEATLV